MFYNISYGASLQSGNYCIGAPGRPAAFILDDGKKWPVSSGAIITDNGSSIASVTTSQFDSYPLGSTLFAVK